MNNRWENPHTDDLAVLQAWTLERRAYLKTALAAGPLPTVQSAAIASSDAESGAAGNADIGGAHPDPLGAIQAELDSLWLTHPHVPEDVRTHVSIAAAEIGANIIEHTGGRQPVGMRMGSELVGDQVHVTFTDDGPPVNIDLASVTMPDATAERGRGLAMAKNVLDQLTYRYDDLGNQWTLISKRFG
jgi:serine/threonine-protein kinase RsbW